ncbi:organic hydroperoxide resistance protein [uncultured Pseudokineococcus sp.]|uniref:organic hydroperoxide resistance protein n=1 Tax=uncultured Pseudokineococcus sp. TaxID=1642928 RepID=UPI00262F1752|nr:organic hydroperoxide resistance protein [uncultured Pseudokineococcus sp.]
MSELTPSKIVYTASVTSSGGRKAGHAVSSDGVLDVSMTAPKETGGPGTGTNPEQLFAAGYATCFTGALGLAGKEQGVDTEQAEVRADIGFGPEGESYAITAELTVRVPGLDQAAAQKLVERTHQLCPYSKAVRGNVPVTLVALAG